MEPTRVNSPISNGARRRRCDYVPEGVVRTGRLNPLATLGGPADAERRGRKRPIGWPAPLDCLARPYGHRRSTRLRGRGARGPLGAESRTGRLDRGGYSRLGSGYRATSPAATARPVASPTALATSAPAPRLGARAAGRGSR